MHHPLKFLAGKQLRDPSVVREVELHEAERRQLLESCESRLFQRDVVILVHVIETDDLVPPPYQQVRDMRAYKTRGAGDENLHSRPSTCDAG